jgi:hypothetical protein
VVHDPLPGRAVGESLALGVDQIPVELTTAAVDVDLVHAQPALSLPEVADSPEQEHDGKG